mgnify:FL=1
MDDDSPWMDDEPSSTVGAVSEQEWTKLSQRYSDVRAALPARVL